MRLLALGALLFAQVASDDPVAALRELEKKPKDDQTVARAQKIVCDGLERELSNGLRALADGRADEAEVRLARAATLARPYNEAYAKLLISLVLSSRRQVRLEGAALVRGVAEDVRGKKPWSDRMARAKRDSPVRVAKDLMASLEARAKEWETAAPQPQAVDAEAAKWMAVKFAPATTCATCKGAGDVACTCREGMVAAMCQTCGGPGTITCLLCGGPGTVSHGGYVGTIKLTLSKTITVKVVLANGKNAQARIDPQVLTWKLGPCEGKGACQLNTSSQPAGGGKAAAPLTLEQKCGRVWKELRDFAFTGRSRIEIETTGGAMERMEPAAAKRFLADYEKCKDGKLVCERCERKTTNPCPSCSGRGSMPAPCSTCAGAASTLCATCGFVGDTTWIAALAPASSMGGISAALDRHASAVRFWAERRAWAAGRRSDLTAQLKAAKQGLDASAVVGPNHVSLQCPICKGQAGECETCWGTGRREYFEGTPQYEKYAAASRLERQLAELSRDVVVAPPMPDVKLAEVVTQAKPVTPPPPPTPGPGPRPSPGTGGTIASLPESIRQQIGAAEAAYDEGCKNLEAAKGSGSDTQKWIDESRKALSKLREAQGGYTAAQEACDAQGLPVPKELLNKFCKNMQALVMARKQAP